MPSVLELPPASPAPRFDAFDPLEVRVTPVRAEGGGLLQGGAPGLALVDASRAGKGTLEMVQFCRNCAL